MPSLSHLAVLERPADTGPCIADGRVQLDAGAFGAAVSSMAARLAEARVARGDVVATLLANRVELVVTIYAAWRLGAVVTPVNPALTRADVGYQLADSKARLCVTDMDDRVEIPTIAPSEVLARGGGLLPESVEVGADDLALLIYTSGTTGNPKGVMLSHGNAGAVVEGLIEELRLTPDDRTLVVLPLFHVAAVFTLVSTLAAGGSAFIADRFERDEFWPLVEAQRPTFFGAVPAIYFFLSSLPADVRPEVTQVRFAICGAAPMPASEITRFEDRYGIPIVEGYGLSESTVSLTVNPLDGPRKPGTVGRPMPNVSLRIADDDGRSLPDGEVGEVLAAGPMIMHGYLGLPEETAEALRDGWLHTGDVGFIGDDGYLRLVDRKKDLIIRGGENIAPKQIEAVLHDIPGVLEAAVVGRADPAMGEEPVAFVVAEDGHQLDPAAVIGYCTEELAAFKVPRDVIVIDALPRNAVGKVTKGVLRDRLRADTPSG